jgi:hypothetical protein
MISDSGGEGGDAEDLSRCCPTDTELAVGIPLEEKLFDRSVKCKRGKAFSLSVS